MGNLLAEGEAKTLMHKVAEVKAKPIADALAETLAEVDA